LKLIKELVLSEVNPNARAYEFDALSTVEKMTIKIIKYLFPLVKDIQSAL